MKYSDIVSIEKIKKVYKTIQKNTHHKEKLVRFELFFSSNIINILDALKEKKIPSLQL